MNAMETITVERSIHIDAPREQVWRALTEPDQIVQWFLPAMPGVELRRDDTGQLTLHMGEYMSSRIAVFETLDAPQRAVSRSLPDRLFATTYTLNDADGGTEVTVTMSGFETLPKDARDERLEVSGTSWAQTLENLSAFVGGKELPHPMAAVAPLFGYWRESRERLSAERSIWIAASRERVWRAITDAEQLEKWFSPGTSWHSTGDTVGSKLFVADPETGAEMYVQVIEAFEPPRRLVTRSVPPANEVPHATEWTLEEENGGTRLTLTHTGYELAPVDTRYISMEQNTFGFGMMLENLQAYVEDKPLPYPGGF